MKKPPLFKGGYDVTPSGLLHDPLRIGLTQSPECSAFSVIFICPLLKTLFSSLPNKNARAYAAGFVTPSGFKPETF
jgi:hypothetical protein